MGRAQVLLWGRHQAWGDIGHPWDELVIVSGRQFGEEPFLP